MIIQGRAGMDEYARICSMVARSTGGYCLGWVVLQMNSMGVMQSRRGYRVVLVDRAGSAV